MAQRLALIHTIPSVVGLFTVLADEILGPDVELMHVADEVLLKAVLAQGGLSPFIFRRVAQHAVAAEEAGASAVQLTCSSISPCAAPARAYVSIPVLTIDEPMVDQAVQRAHRIGVAATAVTTLQPTSDLVRQRAAAAGRSVDVDAVLCQGAHAAMLSGDLETHDRIVRQAVKDLMERNEIVLLAQASMARVAEAIPASERRAPILSTPRLALERARDVLNASR
jgi:Asp/Glu/hydantoin racemase